MFYMYNSTTYILIQGNDVVCILSDISGYKAIMDKGGKKFRWNLLGELMNNSIVNLPGRG